MSQPPSSVKPMDSMRARDSTSRGSASGVGGQRSALELSSSAFQICIFSHFQHFVEIVHRAGVKGHQGSEGLKGLTGVRRISDLGAGEGTEPPP